MHVSAACTCGCIAALCQAPLAKACAKACTAPFFASIAYVLCKQERPLPTATVPGVCKTADCCSASALKSTARFMQRRTLTWMITPSQRTTFRSCPAQSSPRSSPSGGRFPGQAKLHPTVLYFPIILLQQPTSWGVPQRLLRSNAFESFPVPTARAGKCQTQSSHGRTLATQPRYFC